MATYLNFPFDEEVFLYQWNSLKDTTTEAMLNSGAVVDDATVAGLIANGSDTYTMPFYNALSGTPDNYDGQTNITASAPTGTAMSGIVYGRAHGFTSRDFIADFNSGADPMAVITSKVAKWWRTYEQSVLLGELNAVFGITGNADWTKHTFDVTATGSTVADANLIDETSIADAMQLACGDMASQFSLAIMHSKVANRLAKLQLLNYRKYTDPMGIERQLPIADINGLTVIVDDAVGVTASTSVTGAYEYDTFLMGTGAVRRASAPVERPVEVARDAATNGGQDTLYTRIRKTLMPYGFSYTKPTTGYTSSPTDAQLFATANWSIVENPKAIALAKIRTNG